MPVNNEDAPTCKHKIFWKNLWHLKPHVITFLFFNALEYLEAMVTSKKNKRITHDSSRGIKERFPFTVFIRLTALGGY